MPKKSTPDADLKAEFDDLRAIAKEEKTLTSDLNKVKVRKRKAVHALSTKKNANVASMAKIFGVSRQALAKEIGAVKSAVATKAAAKTTAKKTTAKPTAKATTKKAVAKAPAKKAPRRVPRKATPATQQPPPPPVEAVESPSSETDDIVA